MKLYRSIMRNVSIHYVKVSKATSMLYDHTFSRVGDHVAGDDCRVLIENTSQVKHGISIDHFCSSSAPSALFVLLTLP